MEKKEETWSYLWSICLDFTVLFFFNVLSGLLYCINWIRHPLWHIVKIQNCSFEPLYPLVKSRYCSSPILAESLKILSSEYFFQFQPHMRSLVYNWNIMVFRRIQRNSQEMQRKVHPPKATYLPNGGWRWGQGEGQYEERGVPVQDVPWEFSQQKRNLTIF